MTDRTNPRMTLKEYMDYATAHGIGRIKNSPYIILKLFWVGAVLGSIAMVSIQLTRLTEKWNRYPINTKIELKTLSNMRFPAVTVCNLNPLKYSLVKEDRILLSAVQVAANKWGVSMNEFENDGIFNDTIHNATVDIQKFNRVFSGEDLTAEDVIEYFRIQASSEDPDLIASFSHKLGDLLVFCTFNGATCDTSHFKPHRSYEYGYCYTFGSADTNKTVESRYHVFAPGKDHGLTMILNTEQGEYLPFITDSAGMVINVHGPFSRPSAKEHGIIASPGFNTELAVTVEEQDRIPGPTKRCDATNTYEDLAECQRRCFEIAIPTRCGCSIDISDYARDYQYVEKGNNTPIRSCDPNNDTYCVLNTKIAQGFGEVTCDGCLAPCKHVQYKTSVTTARWPSETYRPVLEQILQVYSSGVNFSEADVQANMAQVKIYLPTFTKQTLIEEAAYTDENFVSDIGGQLGLWIGFSVLSLGELLELVILLIGSCCNRKVAPSNQPPNKLPGQPSNDGTRES